MNKFNKTLFNTLYAYKTAWTLSKKFLIGSIVVTVAINTFFTYLLLYFDKIVLDTLYTYEYTQGTIIRLIVTVVIILLSNLIKNSFNTFSTLYFQDLRERVSLSFQNEMIAKIGRMKMKYFESPSYSNFMHKMGMDISNRIFSVVDSGNKLVASLAQIIIGVIICIQYNGYLFIPIALIEIPIVLNFIKEQNRIYKHRQEVSPLERKLSYLSGFFLDKKMIQETKILHSSEYIFEKRLDIFEQLKQEKEKVLFRTEVWQSKEEIIRTVEKYSIYFVYGLFALRGAISIGDFYLAQGATQNLFQSFRELASGCHYLYEGILFIEDYRQFLAFEEEETDKSNVTPGDEGATIFLKNVSFQYPESEKLVLKNICLEIKANTRVAIVGPNGAGKSTLAKLIMGLYDHYSGDIYYNQKNYRDFNPQSVYNCFSVAMQDYYKFPLTLKDNIIISDSKKDFDFFSMDGILRKVGVYTIMDRMPQRENTFLSKAYDGRGTDLSEGEWQKIVLSRAIYRQRPNLIFDEPTAALDPIAEDAFYRQIFDENQNKTVIMISHRLSSTVNADKIIVMDNGRIIEEGTHSQLMASKGKYYQMFIFQAEGYINERGDIND